VCSRVDHARISASALTITLQVIIAYTLGIAAMLMAFAAVPASMGWLQWATVFMIGFFLYGPQVGAGCVVLWIYGRLCATAFMIGCFLYGPQVGADRVVWETSLRFRGLLSGW
jgi:sugar phosphate permease